MYFLSDTSTASFAKQKKQEEKPASLREKIIGRTNAGKAFRVGTVLAAGGLGAYGYKKRGALKNLIDNPMDFYSSSAKDKDITTMRRKQKVVKNPDYDAYLASDNWEGKVPDEYKQVYDANWHDVRRTEKDGRSFVGTGRKVKWGRVGKTVGVGGTALAVPTSLAYLAGNKKDKEDIKNRAASVTRGTQSTLKDARSWINTLHRVSR